MTPRKPPDMTPERQKQRADAAAELYKAWKEGGREGLARAMPGPPDEEPNTPAKGQNMAQRIVLIAGFLVILIMALFPPWVYVYSPPRDSDAVRAERPGGYHLIFNDHVPQDQGQLIALFSLPLGRTAYESELISLRYFSLRIDSQRLEIQIAATLILAAILYLALRSRKTNA